MERHIPKGGTVVLTQPEARFPKGALVTARDGRKGIRREDVTSPV